METDRDSEFGADKNTAGSLNNSFSSSLSGVRGALTSEMRSMIDSDFTSSSSNCFSKSVAAACRSLTSLSWRKTTLRRISFSSASRFCSSFGLVASFSRLLSAAASLRSATKLLIFGHGPTILTGGYRHFLKRFHLGRQIQHGFLTVGFSSSGEDFSAWLSFSERALFSASILAN